MATAPVEHGPSELFRPLDEVGVARKDGVRRVGKKALVLGRLARAGLPVPEGWVLDAVHFDEFVARSLPQKHDLRSLIKLSGTRAGDEQCARAHEELLAGVLDEALEGAVLALWEARMKDWPLGVAVRPSLAATEARAERAAQHLHSRSGLKSPAEVARAIIEVWASSVLSSAVRTYAAADVREIAVALVLQRTVATNLTGVLTRTLGAGEPVAGADWHLGVLTTGSAHPWQRRGQLLAPLMTSADAVRTEPMNTLWGALDAVGRDALIGMGTTLEKELGQGAVLHFAVDPPSSHDGEESTSSGRVHLLGADETPRWHALYGGDSRTAWVELTLSACGREPRTRLAQSVVDRVVESAVSAVLTGLRCKLDGDASVVGSYSGRSYLNLSALASALVDVPLLAPEDLLQALGGMDHQLMHAEAGRARAVGRSAWRAPRVGARALIEQVGFDADVARRMRTVEGELKSLGDLDLTLLPHDAIATTLTSSQAMLERAAELWCRSAAATLAHHLAARTLVRRHLGDADGMLGYRVAAGVGGLHASSFAQATGRVLDVVRQDAGAADLFRSIGAGQREPFRHVSDLPDGRPRGALGQLLATHGDMCLSAFELARPRFREDAADLMRMVALLVDQPMDAHTVDGLVQRARAVADAELVRYEPALSATERRLFMLLRDRSRDLRRGHAAVDRILYRALALLRNVVCDIDRRLRRIDPSVPVGGAFHCSAARLAKSLKSGRPELGRLIRMRLAERREQEREPLPPISFIGSPPRGGVPLFPTTMLQGLGVSPGVIEGPARVVTESLPRAIHAGEVLVVTALDPALAPLCAVAGAVVSEVGGMACIGAELAREMALPAVMSADGATLLVTDGEPLRVDGDRGTVQRVRLGAAGAASRVPPP